MTEQTADQTDDWDGHWSSLAASAEDNPAQRYRRRRTFALLERDRAPVRLVDLGSGQGDLLARAAERWPSAELLGIELSQAGIDASRGKVASAHFLQRNLLESDVPSEEFRGWATHATCSEVLEHVAEPVTLLRNARTFLAPGCRLVVTVPAGPRSAFDRHIGHRQHFRRRQLAQILDDGGFRVDAVHAAGFPAFNLYKLTVIARGKRLVDDVSSETSGGRAAALAMRAFDPLFRFALPNSPFGWQLVATARLR